MSAIAVPSLKILPTVHTVHGVQVSESAVVLKPPLVAQSVQILSDVTTPGFAIFVPAGHTFCALQAVRFAASLYVPAAQALQTRLVEVVPAVETYVPTGQSDHATQTSEVAALVVLAL